ncbi:hypothetical protein BaRGS_00022257, partial [Batillaria attramentaria]
AFINFVLAAGYNSGNYVFFVKFLEVFEASVSKTALLYGVKQAVNSVVGMFVLNAVVERVGVRVTVLAGGFFIGVSAILASFATNLTYLILSQAVLEESLGLALCGMTPTLLIGFYFRRRRSLANCISKCGVGAGAMIFPPMITYFIQEYGVRGALLLVGGICLNGLTAGALMRPLSFYTKRHRLRSARRRRSDAEGFSEDEKQEELNTRIDFKVTEEKNTPNVTAKYEGTRTSSENFEQTPNLLFNNGVFRPVNGYSNGAHVNNAALRHTEMTSSVPDVGDVQMLTRSTPDIVFHTTGLGSSPRRRTASISGSDNLRIRHTEHKMTKSLLDVIEDSSITRYLSRPHIYNDNFVLLQNKENSVTDSDSPKKKSTCTGQACRCLKRVGGVLDFSLFRSPMFRVLTLFFVTSPLINALPAFLPAMSKDKGVTESQAAVLLSIIGGLDLCGRIITGFIDDLKIFKLTRFLTTFPLMIGLAVVFGLLAGVAPCLVPILIMEDIGLEHTAKAMGFCKLFSGAAMAAGLPLLGAFINFVLAAGYNSGNYVFFVKFLEVFEASVSKTALLYGVKQAVNSVVGMFVLNAVVGRVGVRVTVLAGGFFLGVSAILASFATNLTYLILSQAVLHGFGVGLCGVTPTLLIGFYFRRRRSLANSISKCGVGAGAMIFPPMITYFIQEYGVRGALLLVGSICLNGLTAGALMRPLSFYTKRHRLRSARRRQSDAECFSEDEKQGEVNTRTDFKATEEKNRPNVTAKYEENRTSFENLKQKPNLLFDNGVFRPVNGYSNGAHVNNAALRHTEMTSSVPDVGDVPMLTRSTPDIVFHTTGLGSSPRRRTASISGSDNLRIRHTEHKMTKSLLDVIEDSSITRYLSRPHIYSDNFVIPENEENSVTDSDSPKKKSTCTSQACRCLKRVGGVLDFSLFRSPMFRVLTLFFVTAPLTNALPAFLPAMSKDKGLTESQAAVLLSIIGGLDLCGRIITGFIDDLKIFKLTRFLTTFPLMIGLAVVFGLLVGVTPCLVPILIMEDIGLEHTAKAMGFCKLFSGAAMAAGLPLLGYIRDVTGNYDVTSHVIGVSALISAGLLFILRFFPHRHPTLQEQMAVVEEECSPLNSTSQKSVNAGERKPRPEYWYTTLPVRLDERRETKREDSVQLNGFYVFDSSQLNGFYVFDSSQLNGFYVFDSSQLNGFYVFDSSQLNGFYVFDSSQLNGHRQGFENHSMLGKAARAPVSQYIASYRLAVTAWQGTQRDTEAKPKMVSGTLASPVASLVMAVFTTLLIGVFCVTRVTSECPETSGPTEELRALLVGRCLQYTTFVNPGAFCSERPSSFVVYSVNCTNIAETFIEAFAHQEKCNISMDRYQPFLNATYHDFPPDKAIFWEGVYGFVHQYSQMGKRALTLEDVLPGYLIDRTSFCSDPSRKDGIGGLGTQECQGFENTDGCPWNAEFSFWSAASTYVSARGDNYFSRAYARFDHSTTRCQRNEVASLELFASRAKGTISIMLNASTGSAYSPDSFFGRWELPHLKTGDVTHANVWLVHAPGHEVNDVLWLLCWDNRSASECQAMTSSGSHVRLGCQWTVLILLVTLLVVTTGVMYQ